MEYTHALPCWTFVIQLDLNWLVEEFEYVGIMLHLVYARKFDPMALELDGDAHLPTWITTADVRSASTDPTGWIGCTDSIDHRSTVRLQSERFAAGFQGFWTQHG